MLLSHLNIFPHGYKKMEANDKFEQIMGDLQFEKEEEIKYDDALVGSLIEAMTKIDHTKDMTSSMEIIRIFTFK